MNTFTKAALAALLLSAVQTGIARDGDTTVDPRCAEAKAIVSAPSLDSIRSTVLRKAKNPDSGIAANASVRVTVDDSGVAFDALIARTTRDREIDALLVEHARATRFSAAPGCPYWWRDIPYDLKKIVQRR